MVYKIGVIKVILLVFINIDIMNKETSVIRQTTNPMNNQMDKITHKHTLHFYSEHNMNIKLVIVNSYYLQQQSVLFC